MRKFLIAFAFFLGILFVVARISELESILNTLQKGDWRFLLLAAILQSLWLYNVAASYKYICKAIDIDVSIPEMLFVSGALNFANIVAPAGGMSGIAVLIDHARKKGHSTGRAAITNTLYVEFDYLGFFVFLVAGLVVLFRRNNLTATEITASGILLGLALLVAILLYLGMQSASRLEKGLTTLANLVNRILYPFLHREYLSVVRAHTFATEAAEGLVTLKQEPHRIIAPLLLGFSSKVLLLCIFSSMFLAFEVPISPGTLVSGFTISYLFLIVSPTPAGLGFVEGALTLALTSMYIPLGTAVVITVSYRAFSFWMPLLFGLLSFRMVNSKIKEAAPS